jgi:hypothetical protein
MNEPHGSGDREWSPDPARADGAYRASSVPKVMSKKTSKAPALRSTRAVMRVPPRR